MTSSIIGPVPEDWETITLGELCERGGGNVQTGPFGSQLHASDYVASGIPSVMPKNIGENVILEKGIARIAPENAARLKKYQLAEGDIVYSRRGDVERRALVRPENSGWLCGTGCLRVRPGNSVESNFLSHYLGHPDVRLWIVRHAVGATMPNLNTKILNALPVTVPPRREQKAIARVLGALDDKIVVNERIAATIDTLVSAMYEDAIASTEAQELPLGEVADVNKLSTKPLTEGYLRYVDISSVGVGSYDWPERIKWADAPSRARRKASVGDTIWSTVRPNRRSHAFVLDDDSELVFSTGIAILSPKSIGPSTLYEATRISGFQTYLENVAEGSAYPAVRADQFKQAPLLLPGAFECKRFEKSAMRLRVRAHQAVLESRTLAALRDTLLPQLMSGKLRVRDAERIVEDAV